MSSIWTNRIDHLHVRNEVRSRLMNAVTYYQTVGPAGGDAGEKAKNTVCNRRTAQCHHFEPIDPVDYIPVMRSEEGWWMPLPVVEQLLCSGIRMLNLGYVQKRFLGQIKIVKLFAKASQWTRKFSQKPWPEPAVSAFQDLRPGQSCGEAVTLAWALA